MLSTHKSIGHFLPALLMCSLQGCALDPAGLGMTLVQSAMPDDSGSSREYAENFLPIMRSEGCDSLAAIAKSKLEKPQLDVVDQGMLAAARQVQAEKNCAVSGVAGAQANTPATSPGFGSVSATSGLPQTSIAQWIAQETPQKYQGKSCDYLLQALARSQQMEASDSGETRSWGVSKKKVITQAFSGRDCPPSVVTTGRVGAFISPMDPIKATRLGMPQLGASVEKVAPGSPAERAGLRFGDVIVGMDSSPIDDDVDFVVAVSRTPIGVTSLLKVWRSGATIQIPLVVGTPVTASLIKQPPSAAK